MDIFDITSILKDGFNSSTQILTDLGLPKTIQNYKKLKNIMIEYNFYPVKQNGKSGYLIDCMELRRQLAQEILIFSRKKIGNK